MVNDQIQVRGRLLTIDTFSFQHSASGSPSRLAASVNATVYLTPADQGIAAGASTQGPGSGPGSTTGSSPSTPASTGSPSTNPSTPTALAHP